MINSIWRTLARRVIALGVEAHDNEEVILWKQTINVGLSAALWVLPLIGLLYVVFDEAVAGGLYVLFSLLALAHLGAVARWPSCYRFSVNALGLAALVAHQATSLVLGGFVNSGGVVLWGLIFPVTAMLIGYGPRRAAGWGSIFVLSLAVSIYMTTRDATNLPSWLVHLLLLINLLLISANLLLPLGFFINQRDLALRLLHAEQDKTEQLLLNILPRDIAALLREEQRIIADQFEGASILFADLVNFTPLSEKLTAVELVELLNEVFSRFDALVEKYGLEKIKTIGDCYMVASGVPRPRSDHAQVLVRLGLEMRDAVQHDLFQGHQLAFRIGINSGPVVAGVIGRKKFIYDLWGDAVNTASRMESHGAANAIQITRATYELIQADFQCEPRDTIQIKGKGAMETWFVIGPREEKGTRLEFA
ncbi:MAG: adenylate/guanylate cyclase domain-containing protein [Gemmataceae bacterium]